MTEHNPKKRVLVVDDEREILDMLIAGFEEKDIRVTAAENGSRAEIMSEGEKYDAIITDLKMPQLNGLDLIGRIRVGKLNRHTPIFIITGHADSNAIRRVAALGVASIINKPFSTEEVVAKVLDKIFVKPKLGISYDATFINCCLQAARDIMEFYLGTAPTVGKPTVKVDTKTHGYASGIIAICHQNEIRGSLSLTVDKEFITNLAKSVFGEASVTLDGSMIGDVTGEMSNQLVGKLKIHLFKEGYHITIGLPEVVVGENHRVEHKAKNPVLCIPIQCANSNAAIEISLSGAIEKGPAPQGSNAGQESGSIMF
jgi:CheY-like chemotaxis protein